MRTGVLLWHLTGCSTQERRPCTSTRCRADNAGGDIGEEQNVSLRDLTLPFFLLYGGMGKKEKTTPPTHFVACSRWESCP